MEKVDNALPTYEESISPSNDRTATGQRILDDITISRSQNISMVASQYIIPEVKQRAREGLADTTIVLLPSDVIHPVQEKSGFSFEESSSKHELMGFSTDEEVLDFQLEGSINRASFWKQSGVVDDLARLLRQRLSTTPELRIVQQLDVAEASSSKSQKRGLFGRLSSSSNSKNAQSMKGVNPQTENAGESLKVEAKLDEICLRTISEFGLFDTVQRQAIIIRIHVRC